MCDVFQVFDFGSGKGYLSQQLVRQHSMSVIGVDARASNTKSAQRRHAILGRQWQGLQRNATLAAQNVKLTKKEKKKIKETEKSLRAKELETGVSDINLLETEKATKVLETGVSDINLLETEKATKVLETGVSDINLLGTEKATKVLETGSKDVYLSGNHQQRIEVSDVDSCLPRFVPCTLFIDKTTDIMSVVSQCFPEYAEGKCPENGREVSPDCASGTSPLLSDANTNDTIPQTNLDSNSRSISLLPNGNQLPNTVARSSDTASISRTNLEASSPTTRLLLTGLHTCGNLGSASVELFATNPVFQVLCNVGCCYHQLTEKFLNKDGSKKTSLLMPLPLLRWGHVDLLLSNVPSPKFVSCLSPKPW